MAKIDVPFQAKIKQELPLKTKVTIAILSKTKDVNRNFSLELLSIDDNKKQTVTFATSKIVKAGFCFTFTNLNKDKKVAHI